MSGFLAKDFTNCFFGHSYAATAFGGANQAPSVLVAPIDFTTATRSSGVFTGIPSWFSLTCATTNRTARTSATTIVTGLGANALRAYSVDGSTFGLLMEASRTNIVWPNTVVNDVRWIDGTGITPSNNTTDVTDPAGTNTAGKLAYNGSGSAGGFAEVQSSSPNISVTSGENYTASIWARSSIANQHLRLGQDFGDTSSDNAISSTAWTYFSFTEAGPGSQNLVQLSTWRGSTENGAQSIYVYGKQQEHPAKYPSSLIITTSGNVTRAADVAGFTASTLALNGYFHVKMTIAPIYANTEQLSDHSLFFIDSNNQLFLQQSTSKIVLRIGGADVVSAALTWSRDQAISIEAIHSPRSGRSLTVNGITTTGSVVSAITLPTNVYILGNSSGPQECASLQSIVFYISA